MLDPTAIRWPRKCYGCGKEFYSDPFQFFCNDFCHQAYMNNMRVVMFTCDIVANHKEDFQSKGGQSTKGFFANALRLCAALRSFWGRG